MDDFELIPAKLIGFGCDNTNTMVGMENRVARNLIKFCPYMKLNGCFADLLNMANKHAWDDFNTLKEYDKFLKSIYKFFSKAPKKLLYLRKWFLLRNQKYHKVLNIFDIRWLSKSNTVNNYLKNFLGVLDCLLKVESDIKETKKMRDKAEKLYNMATKYENIFLTFVLNDFFQLTTKVCKMFQENNFQLYSMAEIITDLIKYLNDAYRTNPDNNQGIYYDSSISKPKCSLEIIMTI